MTFVGQIRQVNPQPTNVTYKLEDGTGVIEVKKWVDVDKAGGGGGGRFGDDDEMGGGAAGGQQGMEVDSFVRVYGRLKSFNNKRHVGAHVLRPVRDYNEVSYHLLEATYVHLYFTKGPLGANGAPAGAGAGGGDSMFVDGGGPGMAEYAAGGAAANNPANSSKLWSCSPAAQKVYNFLANQPGAQEGVGLTALATGTSLPSRDVLSATDELVGKGLLYTTIDDETWAILDY